MERVAQYFLLLEKSKDCFSSKGVRWVCLCMGYLGCLDKHGSCQHRGAMC